MLILGFVMAQIVIFSVIILVLKRLIFADTTSAINRINKLDSMNREKEKMLASKLDEAEKFLTQRKKELEDEEKRLKMEAQRAAMQLQEDIIKKAKTEAEDIIKKAHASRERMRLEAVVEAEGKAIEFCRDILIKVFSVVVQTQLHEQLVQEFLKDLEEADISKVGKGIDTVEIMTGRAMREGTHTIIEAVLKNKLGRQVDIVVKEDPALLGGLLMKFGTMVVDGTLVTKIKETAEQMKDELNWKHSA